MTKDVIELAREAGMNPNADKDAVNALGSSVPQHWLEHFAALVAAQVKERAAQHIASGPPPMCRYGNRVEIGDSARQAYAAAIRALNTEGEGNDRP